jgi:hypothetical protein
MGGGRFDNVSVTLPFEEQGRSSMRRKPHKKGKEYVRGTQYGHKRCGDDWTPPVGRNI